MLSNLLFYKQESPGLELEKMDVQSDLLKAKNNQLKVKVPKHHSKRLYVMIENNNLFLFNSGICFKSKEPMAMYYAYKKKKGVNKVSFTIFSFSNDLVLEFIVKNEYELLFRLIFNKYFIFTDFKDIYRLSHKVSDGFYSENLEGSFLAASRSIFPSHIVKRYNKQQLQFDNITHYLVNSVHKMKELRGVKGFIEPFMFFETDCYFVISFEKPPSKNLIEFLKINDETLSYKQLIDIMLKFVSLFKMLEERDIQLPLLKPECILVDIDNEQNVIIAEERKSNMGLRQSILERLEKNNNKNMNIESLAIARNSDFKQYSFDLFKKLKLANSPQGKISKTLLQRKTNQVIAVQRISNNRSRVSERKECLYDDEQSDINLNFTITNLEFLFTPDVPTKDNKSDLRIGFASFGFLSNCFMNITQNLNIINMGIIYYYMLSQIDLSFNFEDLMEDKHETLFFNFNQELFKKKNQIYKQVLYYLFTISNLKELEDILIKTRNYERRLQEIEHEKKQSIEILTSISDISKAENEEEDRIREFTLPEQVQSEQISHLSDEEAFSLVNRSMDRSASKEKEFYGPAFYSELTTFQPKFIKDKQGDKGMQKENLQRPGIKKSITSTYAKKPIVGKKSF